MLKHITANKKQFWDLLFLADEQEEHINTYLNDGDLYALYDGDLKSIAVIVKVAQGIYEIKNLATHIPYQHKGYGKRLIEEIEKRYKKNLRCLMVGTGLPTVAFYEKCGYRPVGEIFDEEGCPHRKMKKTL